MEARTLGASQFAAHTGRPEKYLALHFANDIYRNNTGEVMGHADTDPQYYDQVVEFAEAIRMVPLCLKKEQPGYILNSMLVPFLSAAEALYANDVADFETIDKTWMLGTGAPLGPFRIIDIIASGGVSSMEDILRLKKDGIKGAIIGKALYTGAIDLREAIRTAVEEEDDN